jgi:predicted NUDIX family NTP pyrophosphohydrolase
VAKRSRRSAGILLYRAANGGIEVLLAHPGGPVFARKDHGHWSIPKGEIEPGEEPWSVARREFEEETGHRAPDGVAIDLGEIRQKGGKIVVGWALEGDLDPATAHSNTFPFMWPPRSGRWIQIPEIDRVEWFDPEGARARIKETQIPFIDRLLAAIG